MKITSWREAQMVAMEKFADNLHPVVALKPRVINGHEFWTVYMLTSDGEYRHRLDIPMGSTPVVADNGQIIQEPSSPGFDGRNYLLQKYNYNYNDNGNAKTGSI